MVDGKKSQEQQFDNSEYNNYGNALMVFRLFEKVVKKPRNQSHTISPPCKSNAIVVSNMSEVAVKPELDSFDFLVNKSVKDEVQCGICWELLKDPRQCPNGHMFCLECVKQTLNT